MTFSDKLGTQDNRVEQQIEAVLDSTNEDLTDLHDLVFENNKLVMRDGEESVDITKDHVMNILESAMKKDTFGDVYAENSAGIAFAVQYALNELNFGDTLGDIDGLYGNKTKAAVGAFQTKYNEDYPDDLIDVDEAAGPITIGKLFEYLDRGVVDDVESDDEVVKDSGDNDNESSEDGTVVEDTNPEDAESVNENEIQNNNDISEFDRIKTVLLKDGFDGLEANNNGTINLDKYLKQRGFNDITYNNIRDKSSIEKIAKHRPFDYMLLGYILFDAMEHRGTDKDAIKQVFDLISDSKGGFKAGFDVKKFNSIYAHLNKGEMLVTDLLGEYSNSLPEYFDKILAMLASNLGSDIQEKLKLLIPKKIGGKIANEENLKAEKFSLLADVLYPSSSMA